MPYKPGGAKKKVVKAPALRDVAVKEVAAKVSARKAATGRRTTRGNENLPQASVMAAPTSVRHMDTGMPSLTQYCHC